MGGEKDGASCSFRIDLLAVLDIRVSIKGKWMEWLQLMSTGGVSPLSLHKK